MTLLTMALALVAGLGLVQCFAGWAAVIRLNPFWQTHSYRAAARITPSSRSSSACRTRLIRHSS